MMGLLLLLAAPALVGSDESAPPLKYLAPFNPDWQLAIELGPIFGRAGVQSRISLWVELRLAAALDHRRQGALDEAEHHFLAAIAAEPPNQRASRSVWPPSRCPDA